MTELAKGNGLATVFQHAGVAAAYRYRPPYPVRVFDALESLIDGSPRHVLARELMPPDEAEQFDQEIVDVVRQYADDGVLRMEITATVVWGRPVIPAG